LSTTEAKLEESSTAGATQRVRNRTRIHRTSTTTELPVSEDYIYSENPENASMSEFPDVSETTEALRTTTIQESFDAKSVTIDATIIEPKPRQKHRESFASVLNNSTVEAQKNAPADCYCEPEFER
jgi:hypothetical protein